MIIAKRIIGSMVYLGRGVVPEDFCWAWGQLIQYNNEYLLKTGDIIHQLRGNGSGQYLARNAIAATMLGDWVLMLDSDHTFDPDLIHRMLKLFQRNDLDVLTGLYQYKSHPHEFVVYKRQGNLNHHAAGFDMSPNKVMRIDYAGAGTLMIRRRVFEKIAAELKQRPFDLIGEYGEDFSFFERCRLLGIKCWVAPTIQTYHLRTEETTFDDYDPTQMNLINNINGESIQ